MSVTSIAGADRIAELHTRELPQKDNLCGCFWGAIVLRAAGIANVDQDRVAVEAGTTLPEGDPATFVPPGEKPRQDYRVSLPTAAGPGASGTSAPGLARAIERLADGRLVVLPIAGPWTAESVADLIDLSQEAILLANIRSGRLWGSRPDPGALLAHLAGRPLEPPPADWDVGHYVNLVTTVRGPAGSLVVVRDSYRSLGWGGYHLQPADAVAQALLRGDGREGGVLCVCRPEDEPPLRAELERGGYELGHWNNGTPTPSEPL